MSLVKGTCVSQWATVWGVQKCACMDCMSCMHEGKTHGVIVKRTDMSTMMVLLFYGAGRESCGIQNVLRNL